MTGGCSSSFPGRGRRSIRFQRRVFGPIYRTIARLRRAGIGADRGAGGGGAGGAGGARAGAGCAGAVRAIAAAGASDGGGFASATGFTAEAKALVQAGGSPTLVLLGGREDGGWDVEIGWGAAAEPVGEVV